MFFFGREGNAVEKTKLLSFNISTSASDLEMMKQKTCTECNPLTERYPRINTQPVKHLFIIVHLRILSEDRLLKYHQNTAKDTPVPQTL